MVIQITMKYGENNRLLVLQVAEQQVVALMVVVLKVLANLVMVAELQIVYMIVSSNVLIQQLYMLGSEMVIVMIILGECI